MTSRYATPQVFKAALEQRLRNRAAGDGLELQRLRKLVVFDRFLARVFSEFEDSITTITGYHGGGSQITGMTNAASRARFTAIQTEATSTPTAIAAVALSVCS